MFESFCFLIGDMGFENPKKRNSTLEISTNCTQSWTESSYSITLQETNVSPKNAHFEDDFAFPQVGYVNPLEGNFSQFRVYTLVVADLLPIRFFPMKLSHVGFKHLELIVWVLSNVLLTVSFVQALPFHFEDPRTAFWCISKRLRSRGGKRSVLVPLQLWVILRCSLYTYMWYICIHIYINIWRVFKSSGSLFLS